MENPETTRQRRTIQLKPGIILIRLTSGADRAPSLFRVVLPMTTERSITMMSNPLTEDSVLRKDGDCVVIRCETATSIQIEAQPAEAGGKVHGSLDIEYLTAPSSPRKAAAKRPSPAPRPAQQPQPHARACFMAHLSQQGDRFFELGEWIGSPMRRHAIEALSIRPDVPGLANLMLHDRATGQVAAPGEILGTRAQNRPLRAIDLWIAEPDCPERLQIEALYRNSGHLRLIGDRISLVGADTQDVLLGLRVTLTSPTRKRTQHGDTSRIKIYKRA